MRRQGVVALVLAVLAASLAFLLIGNASGQGTAVTTEAVAPPDCSGYAALAKKAYDPEQWWQTADPTPVTKSEDSRLDGFRDKGCGTAIRAKQKREYAAFYDKVITPCGDFANCAVASCESGMGTQGGYTYGFTVYWTAMGPLPKWGNHSRTGTRFAPSEPAANRYEDNVFAAAAFKYGPTPGTCAS